MSQVTKMIAKRNRDLMLDTVLQALAGVSAWLIYYSLIFFIAVTASALVLVFIFGQSLGAKFALAFGLCIVIAGNAVGIKLIREQIAELELFKPLTSRSIYQLQSETEDYALSSIFGYGGPIGRDTIEFYFLPFCDGARLLTNAVLSWKRRLPDSPEFADKVETALHRSAMDSLRAFDPGTTPAPEVCVLLLLGLIEPCVNIDGERVFQPSESGANVLGLHHLPDNPHPALVGRRKLAI